MIEIGDVAKTKLKKVTPRPLQQNIPWTAP